MAAASIRMPDELYERLKAQAKALNRSINELVVETLDRETRRWLARQALAEAWEVREEARARYGPAPASTELIREIREERGDRRA